MPEVRPIDANALNFEKLQDTNGKTVPMSDYIAYLNGAIAAEELVKNTPTLDYEPVVRCKDCVHWKKEKLYIGNNNAVSSKCEWFSSYSTIVGGIYTHRNDFCSYGAKNG